MRGALGVNEGCEGSLVMTLLFVCAGVFRSLRQGHEVTRQDVDAAINRICEESSPLEIDITHCVHR